MDLCTKFSDTISSVHFHSTFALQHPVSSAVEAKLWNNFGIWIKGLLPCKNTPETVLFPLYFDTVPAISLTLVLLRQIQGQKNPTMPKRRKGGFCKGGEGGECMAGLGILECVSSPHLT